MRTRLLGWFACALLALLALNLALVSCYRAKISRHGKSASSMSHPAVSNMIHPAPAPPMHIPNSTWHKLAAASRRYQCRSDVVKAVQRKDRVPLIACEPRARLEKFFATESGKISSKRFDLRLLPRTSKLDDSGFGDRGSCAVVGASGDM